MTDYNHAMIITAPNTLHHKSTHNLIVTYINTVKSETSETLGDQFHNQYWFHMHFANAHVIHR